jgi:hypothetical protein
MTAGSDWRATWIDVLVELELDIAGVEASLTEQHQTQDLPQVDPWTPPPGLGPIPLDLQPRADAVLERQLAAALAVVAALTSTQRQALVAGRLRSGDDPTRPAYVDCSF